MFKDDNSTNDNDLVRVGCDVVHEHYLIDLSSEEACESKALLVSIEGFKWRYSLLNLKVGYVDKDFNIIEIIPNYIDDPSNNEDFKYVLDPLPLFLPADENYKLFYIDFDFDIMIGYQRNVIGNPGVAHQLVTLYKSENESSWNSIAYSPNRAYGIKVSGLLSELLNDPIKEEYLTGNGFNGMHIEGSLTVDVPYYFGNEYHNYITGSAGYQIIVNQNIGFGGCIITGCTSMWKGFEVDNNSELRLESCELNDAEVGIHLNPGSKASCFLTSLTNNPIGILSESGIVYNSDNEFKSDINNWKTFFTGQTEFPINNYCLESIYSKNGIVMEIGSIYSDQYNGIISENSLLSVQHAYFNSMHHLSDDFTGNGILVGSQGGSKYAKIFEDCEFDNCRTGIRIYGQRTDVLNSIMSNVHYGIVATNTASPLNLRYNVIDAVRYGIQFNSCTGASKNIDHNTISINGTNDIDDGCIYVQNPRSATIIRNNDLSVNGGIFGYRITPGYSSYLINNVSTLSNSGRSFGFGYHIDGNRSNLSCNIASGPSTPTHDLFGFHENMANANFNCNESVGNRRGFSILENNLASNFRGNTIGGAYGLHVEENSRLGLTMNLINQGNCWSGSAIKEALNKNQIELNVVLSQFKVDKQEQECYLPDWEANGDWFLDFYKLNESYSCGSNCPTGGVGAGIIEGPCDFTSAFSPFILDSVSYSDFEDERRWTDKFQIYKLLIDSKCSSLGLDLEEWKSETEESEQGQLVAIEDGIKSLLIDKDSLSGIVLDSLNFGFNIAYNNLINLIDDEDFRWDSSITIQALHDLDSIQANIDAYWSSYLEGSATILDSLLTLNSSITTSSTLGERLKYVYDIMIRSMMSDTFCLTNTEIEDLLEISKLCPGEGSFATLIARGLFHTFVADSVFDDRPCYIYESQALSYKNSEIHILKCEPNPTNEFVNIFTNVGQIITSYSIFNTVGKKVLSQTNLEDSRVNINLSSLNSGIYIINANTSDGQIVSNKINYIK